MRRSTGVAAIVAPGMALLASDCGSGGKPRRRADPIPTRSSSLTSTRSVEDADRPQALDVYNQWRAYRLEIDGGTPIDEATVTCLVTGRAADLLRPSAERTAAEQHVWSGWVAEAHLHGLVERESAHRRSSTAWTSAGDYHVGSWRPNGYVPFAATRTTAVPGIRTGGMQALTSRTTVEHRHRTRATQRLGVRGNNRRSQDVDPASARIGPTPRNLFRSAFGVLS